MTNSNSSNSPYILEMRNVSKTFPGVKALDQINLGSSVEVFML